MSTTPLFPPDSGNKQRHLEELYTLSKAGYHICLVIVGAKDCLRTRAALAEICHSILFLPVNSASIRIQQFFLLKPKWLSYGLNHNSRQQLQALFESMPLATVIANYFLSFSLVKSISPAHLGKTIFVPHDIVSEFYCNALKLTPSVFKKIYYYFELVKHKYYELDLLKQVRHLVAFTKHDLNYYFPKSFTSDFIVSPVSSDFTLGDKFYDAPPRIQHAREINIKKCFAIVASGKHPLGRNEINRFINKLPLCLRGKAEIHIIGGGWPLGRHNYGNLTVNYLGYVDDLKATCSNYLALIVPIFFPTGINVKLVQCLSYGPPVIATLSSVALLPKPESCPAIQCLSIQDFANEIDRLMSIGDQDCQLTRLESSRQNSDYLSMNLSSSAIMNSFLNYIENV